MIEHFAGCLFNLQPGWGFSATFPLKVARQRVHSAKNNLSKKKRAIFGWSGCNDICPAFVNLHLGQKLYRCIRSSSDRLGFYFCDLVGRKYSFSDFYEKVVFVIATVPRKYKTQYRFPWKFSRAIKKKIRPTLIQTGNRPRLDKPVTNFF